MELTKSFILNAKKAYKNIAKLEIDGDKLIIRDIRSGELHPFVDGRFFIPIKSQKVKLMEWI